VTVRVRIAPSPTGNLHIGTAAAQPCLTGFLPIITRVNLSCAVEDTDLERSRPEYTENIQAGLQWLGLNWDECLFFKLNALIIIVKPFKPCSFEV
jgi:glutamyl-tRNA synthetase